MEEKDLGSKNEAEQIRKALDNFLDMVLKEMRTDDGEASIPPATDRLNGQGLQISEIPLEARDRIEDRQKRSSWVICDLKAGMRRMFDRPIFASSDRRLGPLLSHHHPP